MVTERYTFPVENRLNTKADYQAVFSQPLRSRSPYFTMLARPNEGKPARLGPIVAKKMIRRAVRRNKIRRLIRESFRHNKTLLAGLDVVVLLRCTLPQLPNQVFYDCLKKQWKEITEQWKKE